MRTHPQNLTQASSTSLSPKAQRISQRALSRHGIVAVTLRLITAGATFILQVLLARILGIKGYGEYAIAFAWMQTLATFARMGLDKTVLRYASVYGAELRWEKIRGLSLLSQSLAWASGLTFGLLLAIGAWIYGHEVGHRGYWCLLVATATVPFYALIPIQNSFIRAFGGISHAMFSDVAIPTLLLIFTLTLVGSDMNFNSVTATSLHLTITVLVFCCTLFLRYRSTPLAQVGVRSSFDIREWLRTAIPLGMIAGFTLLQTRMGILLCGFMLGSEETGVYSAMRRISDVVVLGQQSVNFVTATNIAVFHAQRRSAELQKCVRWSAVSASSFMLVVSLPLVIGGPLISKLFGSEFESGYPSLLLLLAGGAVSSVCGPAGNVMSMSGLQKQLLGLLVVGVLLNLFLSASLIPFWGITGAALANALSLSMWNIAMTLVVRGKLGVWTNVGRVNSTSII